MGQTKKYNNAGEILANTPHWEKHLCTHTLRFTPTKRLEALEKARRKSGDSRLGIQQNEQRRVG